LAQPIPMAGTFRPKGRADCKLQGNGARKAKLGATDKNKEKASLRILSESWIGRYNMSPGPAEAPHINFSN